MTTITPDGTGVRVADGTVEAATAGAWAGRGIAGARADRGRAAGGSRLRAVVTIVAELDGRGATRFAVLRGAAPVSLRPTPDGLYLVGSAAGPLGGDVVRIDVEVRTGAALTVRTAAAGLALPGRDGAPSAVTVTASVGPGACLRWLPEPLVAVAGCRHTAVAAVRLADGAALEWRDELVLGRHDEPPGDVVTRVAVDVAGRPLVRHELRAGPSAPGWDGPGALGRCRAAGSLLQAGPGHGAATTAVLSPAAAILALEGPGTLTTATAPDAPTLRRLLAGRR